MPGRCERPPPSGRSLAEWTFEKNPPLLAGQINKMSWRKCLFIARAPVAPAGAEANADLTRILAAPASARAGPIEFIALRFGVRAGEGSFWRHFRAPLKLNVREKSQVAPSRPALPANLALIYMWTSERLPAGRAARGANHDDKFASAPEADDHADDDHADDHAD